MKTEHIASSRGVTLAVHHFGGDGPPLLVNHATGFHARCYLPMMPTLTEHFDVWGADFAGHGGSTPPANGDFAWDGFTDDVLAVVDHIGADSVFAFGHSMGGTATLRAAQRRPGVIRAAWVFEPIVFPRDFPRDHSRMTGAARRRTSTFGSRAEALYNYASKPPLGWLRADALAAYVEHGFVDNADGSVNLACAPESEAQTFENAEIDVSHIEGLELPVTIACGGVGSEPGPAAFAQPIVDALPHATSAVFERLGHLGPMQDPDRIAAEIVASLR